jgi:DNA-binding GntR family transcriptional regulator
VAGRAVEQAYEEIKRRLMRGKMVAGERVDVVSLCRQIGVSRTPVREALVALEKEGFVQAVPRRGYFVREISFQDALEAYQLRIVLEPIATALAARRVQEDDLAVLRDLAEIASDGSEESITRAVERNRRFHVRIAEASGNSQLAKIMTDLMDNTERLLYIELDTDRTYTEWSEEHLVILEALEARDSERAAMAARATFARDSMFLSARVKDELGSVLGRWEVEPGDRGNRRLESEPS